MKRAIRGIMAAGILAPGLLVGCGNSGRGGKIGECAPSIATQIPVTDLHMGELVMYAGTLSSFDAPHDPEAHTGVLAWFNDEVDQPGEIACLSPAGDKYLTIGGAVLEAGYMQKYNLGK